MNQIHCVLSPQLLYLVGIRYHLLVRFWFLLIYIMLRYSLSISKTWTALIETSVLSLHMISMTFWIIWEILFLLNFI